MIKLIIPALLSLSLVLPCQVAETFAETFAETSAKTQDAARPNTAEAVLVFEVDGPALLRSRFRTTNLGAMLAAKEADDLWSSILQPVRQLATSLGEGVPAQMDALFAVLKDHRGRVRIVVDLYAGENARGRWPELSATVIVEPDGRTDLEAIAKAARSLLETMHVKKVELGDAKLRVAMIGRDLGLVLPRVIDGRLIFTVSENIARSAELAYPARSAMTRLPKSLQKAGVAARLDFARVLPLLKKDIPSWLFDESDAFLDAFGLSSLVDVTLSVGTAGPRVQGEVTVGFGDGERGLLAAIFPSTGTLPAGDSLAPSDEDWQSGHFDLMKLFTSFYELAAASPFGFDLESSVNENMGVRFVEDLLAHMDGTYLELGSLMGRGDEEGGDSMRYEGPEVCFAFGLKNAEAFAKSWKECAQTIELWDDDAVKFEGVDVHQGSLFGFSSESATWAIVEDQFVISYGEDRDTDWLKGILHRRLAQKEAGGRALSAEWKRLLRYAPPGHNGSGELDVIGLFRDVRWDLLEEFTGPALNGMSESTLKELLPLMRQFDVTRGVTMTGHDGWRWRYRVLW